MRFSLNRVYESEVLSCYASLLLDHAGNFTEKTWSAVVLGAQPMHDKLRLVMIQIESELTLVQNRFNERSAKLSIT